MKRPVTKADEHDLTWSRYRRTQMLRTGLTSGIKRRLRRRYRRTDKNDLRKGIE